MWRSRRQSAATTFLMRQPLSSFGHLPYTATTFLIWQVRLESRRTESTRLLYCTTGIALRMMLDEDPLRHVSHVVLDEARATCHHHVTPPRVTHVVLKRPRVTHASTCHRCTSATRRRTSSSSSSASCSPRAQTSALFSCPPRCSPSASRDILTGAHVEAES